MHAEASARGSRNAGGGVSVTPDDLAGAPQVVLDVALPPLEVPALQVTWHFIDGRSHTITAPEEAFKDDGHGIELIDHNGTLTQVCRHHVTFIETRHVMLKVKQKAGQK